MKSKIVELDVDYIGGLGSLTKEQEQALSKHFKAKKLARAKKHSRLTRTTRRKKVSS